MHRGQLPYRLLRNCERNRVAENRSLCEHYFLLSHWYSHWTSIVFSSSLQWERTMGWYSLGINTTNLNPMSCYWIHQLEKEAIKARERILDEKVWKHESLVN